MDSKSAHDFRAQSPKFSFEDEILQSLSLIYRNVSEFFSFYEQSLRISGSPINGTLVQSLLRGTGQGKEDPSTEALTWFGLILVLSLITWSVNGLTLQSNWIRTWTEVVVSWSLVLVTLPLILLGLGGIILVRIGVAVWIKVHYGGRVWLADPFDVVWRFERPASSSTCVGLYVVEGAGELERVRELLYTRVMLKEVKGEKIYDRFRWSLREVQGFVCWERLQHFDLTDHVKLFSAQSRKDPSQVWTEDDLFRELEAQQDSTLVRKGRSPWEILLVPKYEYKGGEPDKEHYALVFLINHCLMDGVSMGNILHSCIADRPFQFAVDPIAPLRVPRLTVWAAYAVSFLLLPRITLRNLFFFEKNAFHGPSLTGPKRFLWSRPIRLDSIKELKNRSRTSVFSVLLSSLGGSMRRLYLRHGQRVPQVIHACPPVAILPYPDRKPRNRFSVVLYPLAIGKETCLQRLDAIFRASKRLASSPDVISNYYVVYILGLLPMALLKVLAPLAHATMTFSNIPGPTETVRVLNGDKLVEIGAWIPIKNTIGIGMTLFSYGDRLRVTFVGDQASLPNPTDLEELRDGFELELSQLSKTLGLEQENLFISTD